MFRSISEGKNFGKYVKIFAFFIVPLLLTTVGLMIADLIKGKMFLARSGAFKTCLPDTYILNNFLTFVIAFFVCYISWAIVDEKQQERNTYSKASFECKA